jgi:hypothetical protein
VKRLALVTCALPLLAGCVTVNLGAPDAVPNCDPSAGRVSESFSPAVVLMAQSVPSASLLPCIDALPVGWTFARLDANDHRAKFWLSSDRGGERVLRVAVERVCDLGSATETPSDQAGTRRFDLLDPARPEYHGDRYYVYPGGCTSYHFDIHGAAGSSALTTVLDGLGFVSRDSLRKWVHDYSDGRFELDPTAPVRPAPSDSTHS